MPYVHSRSRAIAGQTWAAAMPLSTHWGPAGRCADIGCKAMERGWGWTVPQGSDLEARARRFVKEHGYSPIEAPSGSVVRLVFPAGTPCPQDGKHRAQLEREAVLVHRNESTGKQEAMRRASWHERWAEHLDRLARLRG